MLRYFVWLCILFMFALASHAQTPAKNFYAIQKEMEQYYASPEKHKGSYKQWRRAEYYMRTRLGPNGEIVNTETRNWNAWQQYSASRPRHQNRAYSGNWEFFGPFLIDGNPGIGRINRIAFHPTDTNMIYIATAGGGLYFTNNHGIDWAPLTESLPVNNLSGVVVDYTDPDNIYIFTGDGDGSGGGARGYFLRKSSIGVLKSTNGGDTWKPTGLSFAEPDLVWSYDLVQHPVDPDILLAATNIGVYVSPDAGDTWLQVLETITYELHFKLDDPSVLFAVSKEYIFRSTSLGFDWDTIPIPPLNESVGRMTLTTCAQNPQLLYLVASPETSDSTEFRGLFQSLDGGQTFNMVIDTPNIIDFQSNYDLTMICNPVDVNDLIVGAVNTWKTTNSGTSWAQTGGLHADVHDLQVNPLNGWLYSANDGGLYYSEDFGTTWNFISEYCGITQYYKMAVSQQNAEIVIAGAQDNGTHRNHEGNTQEMDKIHHSDGMDCAIHPSNDSMMIYSAQNGKFWISHDQGATEDSLIHPSSLPASVDADWVTPVAWDPGDTNNIYIGYKPIYRSFDGGLTFNAIPDTISGLRILHVAAADGDRLYAGDQYTVAEDVVSFHLWTSADQGNNWTPIHTSPTFPDTSYVISSLFTHPDDASDVWITIAGYVDSQKVYRSLDAGLTWINMSGSLPNTTINTIALQNTVGAGNYGVYIGTDIGVFFRNESLGDWIMFSNGLPIVEISDLEINEQNDKILVSTHGRGIWSADLFSACSDVIHIDFSMQNDDHSYYFQASDSIISQIPVDNSFGVRIAYKAGDVVLLREGFRSTTKNGANFRALLGNCGEGGIVFPNMNIEAPIPNNQVRISTSAILKPGDK